MRAKFVNENIRFERGRGPKARMGIGQTVENRDPAILQKNFRNAFPEVNHTHTSTSFMHAPGIHPIWKRISISLENPKDDLSVEERGKIFMDWFKTHTDYDIVEKEHFFDRKWHPWGDESKPEQYSQSFIIKMRNEEDMQ